uniref:Si:ch211-57i17.1 n=1 Tax=Sinocyclocheilus grahami TaxID=75366 RepID=A0A672T537_SINGR
SVYRRPPPSWRPRSLRSMKTGRILTNSKRLIRTAAGPRHRRIHRLRGLCMSELLERLEEVERQIRGFSEELIDQLAVREELDYEKEVKNTFISALIHVQNRQKEHRELLKKKRKIKTTGAEQRSNRSHVPGTYLTTVIPYDKSSGAPSVEDLQILTKILHAMREDSDTVPALLTDYILKGIRHLNHSSVSSLSV